MNVLYKSALCLLLGVSVSSYAAPTAQPVPQFKDYPVTNVYQGAPAPLVMTDFSKLFKTRLREALNTKPVFAGDYVLATWGCGAGCVMNTFVNKRTGRVVDHGFGGEFGPYLTAYRLNSRLLVAQGPVMDKQHNDTGKYAVYFYLLKNGQLHLLKQRLIPRPADSNHDGLPD